MRNNPANGTEGRTDWNAVDWRQVNRRVRNLRQRIFRATRENDLKKVRSLQKLMLRSYSNTLKAVRLVTQENKGKYTAGVDRIVVLTIQDRNELVDSLMADQPWRSAPVRRVHIPKANGKLRPLGIPTVRDRALQARVKNALEPFWEAQFEPCSYGFRPGRGCHDAIARIYNVATPIRRRKWVLDADIKGAFDNIGHDYLLNAIGKFPGRELIRQWLKAGYMERGRFHHTSSGTPQGGVISPLLANIALHGMETAVGVKYISRGDNVGKRCLIRYADDFVVFCHTEEDARKAQSELSDWLAIRGLVLSTEKTRIAHLSDGFDFLGFNIRQYRVPGTRYGSKLLIKPSRKSVESLKVRLIREWRALDGQNITVVLARLNPVIRGWSNYYRGVVSKRLFCRLDNWIFNKEVQWARRTHSNKPWYWVQRKYWGALHSTRMDRWVFGDAAGTGGYLIKFAWTPIVRHVLVKGGASPDDPSLNAYWASRRSRRRAELPGPQRVLARKQRDICPRCGESLHDDEPLCVHHLTPLRLGGKRTLDNRHLLHYYCHLQFLSEKKSERDRLRFA
jgi:RNA-directed DNA polymerase